MTQNSINIINNSPSLVREAINNAMLSIVDGFYGETAPVATYANMTWFDITDTADIIWKQRNQANDTWIVIAHIKANKIYFEGLNVNNITQLTTHPSNYDIVYRDRNTGECYIKI